MCFLKRKKIKELVISDLICPNCKTTEHLDVSHIDTVSFDHDGTMYVHFDVSCDGCGWEKYCEFKENV